jgi:RNA polymerase sigma factor (sigma-70 family)
VTDDPTPPVDEGALRALVPRVLAGLLRRGEDFDAAEDALQEALLEALRVWPENPPRDPRAWLSTVATRRLVDARRSEAARYRREEATLAEPRPTAVEEGDDTLFLLFCCCHPDLAPASQVALTLRAVGGLTTREIADAFYVPEATMAQRISRAKGTLRGRRLDRPGDLAVVLRVLYLVYSAGHAGRVDLAGEAIRLARQLTLATEEPEARGLLALMLLNHARLPARVDAEGRIVPLDRQDRALWDTREIAEGVRVLQSALAVQTEERRPGRYQVEAAIAALHDDAATAEETDWPQILAWYDDLVALTDHPVREDPAAVLGRAVAVAHVLGADAGLRETDRLREVIGDRHRWHAVRGYLYELGGDLPDAAEAYAEAARLATNVTERDHLVRQAARARAAEPARTRSPGSRHASVVSYDPTIYQGAAAHYRSGRPAYSPQLEAVLTEELGLDGTGRLLDAGCGPGILTVRCAHLFEEAVGLDPDAAMLEEGRRLAAERNVPNIRWVRARAEDLPAAAPGPYRVVTFGQSFHWTDEARVAEVVYDLLEPGGALALIVHTVQGRPVPASPGPPPIPHAEISAVVEKYLGPTRRAGRGAAPVRTHRIEDVLVRTRFGAPRSIFAPGIPDLVRSSESVLSGYLSLSSSAPHLFGDRLEDFAAEVRELLATRSPQGLFWDWPGDTEIILARKAG